MYVTHLQL